MGIKDDPLLNMARKMEQIALSDPYFVDCKLYPNVHLDLSIILRAMGFPTYMFTVLFALARTVGWISQWKEMIEDASQRIGRPRQLYVGPISLPRAAPRCCPRLLCRPAVPSPSFILASVAVCCPSRRQDRGRPGESSPKVGLLHSDHIP